MVLEILFITYTLHTLCIDTLISNKPFSVHISLVNIMKMMKAKDKERKKDQEKKYIIEASSSCSESYVVVDQ